MTTTKKLAAYIESKAINIAALGRMTKIPYQTLYDSVKGSRKITADELLKICSVLDVNPMDFAESKGE